MDTDQVRRDLEHLFPGVVVWLGRCTGHWWAMLGDRLLEAGSPRELADQIRAGIVVRPVGRMDGSSLMHGRGRGVGRGGYVR